jgi:hypothetical protein
MLIIGRLLWRSCFWILTTGTAYKAFSCNIAAGTAATVLLKGKWFSGVVAYKSFRPLQWLYLKKTDVV